MKTKNILFYSFVITLLSVITIYAQTKTVEPKMSDSSKNKYTLENCINTFNKDKIDKTDVGFQYWFFDKNFADGKTLKMSCVKPHSATHAPHAHIEDEFYYILEGKADVFLSGKWKSIPKGSGFYCPSNIEHGIRNTSKKELRYLVIKKYETK